MKGSSHILLGTSLGLGFQLTVNLPMTSFFSYPSFYGGVILGSLLPDIDHPRSYLGSRIYPLSAFIHRFFGHRGFTHSLLSFLLLGAITAKFWAFNSLLFGGILLGYFSHLLGDMTTPRGIPLFYPSKKRYSFFPRKAG